ncbi:hypothetical protein, partial [Bacteroides uniformis]|uniref:hypothetical protein n=1 Tax=Bacteroides uniformis TaxID=820 RepID=UPI001E332E50
LWDDNKEKSGVHYCPELLSGMTFLPEMGFLSKTQTILCFSPFVCLLLHRELMTPNGHEQPC